MDPRPPHVNRRRTRRLQEAIYVLLVLLGLAILGYAAYYLWP